MSNNNCDKKIYIKIFLYFIISNRVSFYAAPSHRTILGTQKKHYSQGLSVDYNAFYYFSNIMSGSFSEFIFTLLILITSCE